MYPSLMHTEYFAARQHELIANTAEYRLNRQAHLARRAERRNATTPHVRRSWMRLATRPAHS